MKSKFLVPTALLSLAGLLPLATARADVVLSDSVGFIRGTQIFTDSFDLATPGVLTVTLAAVPWLDTLQDLNCFLTSPSGGVLGSSTTGGFDSVQVKPGVITVNWYGTDPSTGTFGTGVYGLKIDFQPDVVVPAPPALPLLLSGLGILSMWRRARRTPPLPG